MQVMRQMGTVLASALFAMLLLHVQARMTLLCCCVRDVQVRQRMLTWLMLAYFATAMVQGITEMSLVVPGLYMTNKWTRLVRLAYQYQPKPSRRGAKVVSQPIPLFICCCVSP